MIEESELLQLHKNAYKKRTQYQFQRLEKKKTQKVDTIYLIDILINKNFGISEGLQTPAQKVRYTAPHPSGYVNHYYITCKNVIYSQLYSFIIS